MICLTREISVQLNIREYFFSNNNLPHQTSNSFFTATSSLPKIWEKPCESTFSTYATPNIIRYIIGIFNGNMKFILSVNSAYCTRYISNVREEMKYTTFPHNALSSTFVIFSQLQNMKKK